MSKQRKTAHLRKAFAKAKKRKSSCASTNAKKAKKILVTDPKSTDVLFGRGTGSNDHNTYYHDLLRQRWSDYRQHKKTAEKSKIAQSIVNEIKKNGGSFLDREGKSKPWYVADDKIVLGKVKQALRDIGNKNKAYSPLASCVDEFPEDLQSLKKSMEEHPNEQEQNFNLLSDPSIPIEFNYGQRVSRPVNKLQMDQNTRRVQHSYDPLNSFVNDFPEEKLDFLLDKSPSQYHAPTATTSSYLKEDVTSSLKPSQVLPQFEVSETSGKIEDSNRNMRHDVTPLTSCVDNHTPDDLDLLCNPMEEWFSVVENSSQEKNIEEHDTIQRVLEYPSQYINSYFREDETTTSTRQPPEQLLVDENNDDALKLLGSSLDEYKLPFDVEENIVSQDFQNFNDWESYL